MEVLIDVDAAEREKFERFIDFCRGEGNIYLIICGDKETFFEWYPMLHGISTAALYELRPTISDRSPDEPQYKPLEVELLQTNRNLEKMLEDILSDLKGLYGFRSMMAFFINSQEGEVKRHSMDEIDYETLLPDEDIIAFVTALKEKNILKETESQGISYYSLTSRYLREPLYKALRLDDFDARGKVRTILKKCIDSEVFLDSESLTLVDAWKDHMMFNKDEMGHILGSCIACDEEYGHFVEKAKKDGKGIDIQPILKLIPFGDVGKRTKAVKLLIDIRDKAMINPLLLHIKEEDDTDIKNLIVKGIGLTEKKKAIIAIINMLRETGDKQLRLEAIEFFYSRFGDDFRKILLDIRETEDDQTIIKKIDQLLSRIRH
jgi:hypothetical protein